MNEINLMDLTNISTPANLSQTEQDNHGVLNHSPEPWVLGEGIMRNISENLFCIWTGQMSFIDIFYLQLRV